MLGQPNDKRLAVYQVVAAIPAGQVLSYGAVAKLAGLPGYARYVGGVLKDLPSDTDLPWHRVINAKGEISFPVGSAQYRKQRERLEDEGVTFVGRKVRCSGAS